MSYSNGPRIITDGLVCYFDFGNIKSYPGTGTSIVDLTGNNSAVTENSPTFSATNKGSLYLNGTNQRIAITTKASTIRNYNATTCFTVKLPLYSGSQRCILSYRSNGGNMYIGKQSGGIFVYYNGLSSTPAYTAGSITDNTISVFHVVCDSTNNMLYLYINGSLIGSGVARTGWTATYNTIFYLGYDAGGTNEYMIGDFYNFQHYNKVLSASEISQNYNAIKGRFNL